MARGPSNPILAKVIRSASSGASRPSAGGVGRQADDEPGVHVRDLADVPAQQRLPAGQEHPCDPVQVVPDGFELCQGGVGDLERLGAEDAAEIAPLGDLQDHRQRYRRRFRDSGQVSIFGQGEVMPGRERHRTAG